ncbi:MAG: hypothetical protein KKF56_05035 [Nanoarchaeota archaeon]|nr:hypothetical protein [Nanoarchaeota archaeon]
MNKYFNRINIWGILGIVALILGGFRIGEFYESGVIHVGGVVCIIIGILIISIIFGFTRARINRLEEEQEKRV